MIDLENNTSHELDGNIKLLQGSAGNAGAAVQAKGLGISDIKIQEEPLVLNTIDEPISETIVTFLLSFYWRKI